MARKKRQYLQPEQAQEPVSAMLPSVWETAIYARLSVENSKKNDDGDSIEGQIEIAISAAYAYLSTQYQLIFDYFMQNS